MDGGENGRKTGKIKYYVEKTSKKKLLKKLLCLEGKPKIVNKLIVFSISNLLVLDREDGHWEIHLQHIHTPQRGGLLHWHIPKALPAIETLLISANLSIIITTN